MKVAFVVQRCGTEVNGGAESLCLQIAQRMAKYWDTEVLTTCARDYMTWEDWYSPGLEKIGATAVRRFPVDAPRDIAEFNRISAHLLAGKRTPSIAEQENWMREQGPMSGQLLDHIARHRGDFDAFIFFGYLYATTYFGLPLVREKAYLAPLGHDEWPIHLSMWDPLFAMPRGFIFQTEEELAFLRQRFPMLPLNGPVAGIGVDLPTELHPEKFRETYRLTEPFVLYVGRVDASKGCDEMFAFFKGRAGVSGAPHFKLVVIGKEVLPVPFHDDIVYLGFVSEEEKWDAMAACDWMLLPSRYESLSISLLETWAAGRPGIVNAQSEVLMGHCRRGNGGLWYNDWKECEAILRLIDARTKDVLGQQGRAYVTERYSWSRVEGDYLRALEAASSALQSVTAEPARRLKETR